MEANSGHVKDHTEEQPISQTWSITKGQKVSDVAGGRMTWRGITHFDNRACASKHTLVWLRNERRVKWTEKQLSLIS